MCVIVAEGGLKLPEIRGGVLWPAQSQMPHDHPFGRWAASPSDHPTSRDPSFLPSASVLQPMCETVRRAAAAEGYRALQRHTPGPCRRRPLARMCRRPGAIPPQRALLSHPLGSRLHLIAQDCAIWPLGGPRLASGSSPPYDPLGSPEACVSALNATSAAK